MKDQKAGILNAMSQVATPKVAEVITDHIIEVGLENVTLESVSGIKDVSDSAAKRVVGAIEFHNTLKDVKVRKQREKKPSVAERYAEETTVEQRDDVAVQVAELRINAEGSRPRAWRSIREQLGLKNEQFHKVIRKSGGWKQAVADRINTLLEQEGGWTYSGKLDVLTGIDGISMDEIKSMKREEEPTAEETIDLQAIVESAPRPIDTPAAA